MQSFSDPIHPTRVLIRVVISNGRTRKKESVAFGPNEWEGWHYLGRWCEDVPAGDVGPINSISTFRVLGLGFIGPGYDPKSSRRMLRAHFISSDFSRIIVSRLARRDPESAPRGTYIKAGCFRDDVRGSTTAAFTEIIECNRT